MTDTIAVVFDGNHPVRAYPDMESARDDPEYNRRRNEQGLTANKIQEIPFRDEPEE